MNGTRKTALAAFMACAALTPLLASAAEIYFDPATGKYPPGATWSVDVRLNNQGECINAAEVDVRYPPDLLQAVDVSEGNSIFTLWVKDPVIYPDYGVISFIGGIPGGYCGRIPGDPSLSNKLATLIFRFPTSSAPQASGTAPSVAELSFVSSTRVVLNDGFGTVAPLAAASGSYSMITSGQFAPVNSWENALQADTVPPEPFKVSVYRNQSLFDNQLFAVFSTVDKQTGIDHYEVAEVPSGDMTENEDQWHWVRATSPYLLHDQNLNGAVAVRAIDKAGNERLEEYMLGQIPPAPNWQNMIIPYLAIIGFTAFALVQIVLRLLL